MKFEGFYYDGSTGNNRMDEEVIKIEALNSVAARSSASSIDQIPLSKIEIGPIFILRRQVLDNIEN